MVFAGCIVALKYIVTKKGKLICLLVMLGCILGIVAIFAATYVPYNPRAAEKKRQQQVQQQQENQWIQENFGNGKGKEIQHAIDDYRNN